MCTRYLMLSFLVLFFANAVMAGSDAKADKQLLAILQEIKNADGYSYKVNIVSEIVGRPKEQETMTMSNYQSRKSFLIYSRTSDLMLFVCEQGQIRVSLADSTIQYTSFPKDPVLRQENKERMMASFDAYSLEGLFLEGASIALQKTTKDKITYKLQYPEASMVQSCVIEANPKTLFVNRLEYTIERNIAGSESLETSLPSRMRQRVVMNGYVQAIPAEVSSLVAASEDLEGYLKRNFSGYRIERTNL